MKRFKTPHREVLTHRIWAERIQRRYPKSWRFTRWLGSLLGNTERGVGVNLGTTPTNWARE